MVLQMLSRSAPFASETGGAAGYPKLCEPRHLSLPTSTISLLDDHTCC